jgi:iron complex transport system ATP-binding protein
MTQRLSETARRTNGTPQHEAESATGTDDTAALAGNELVLEYSSGGQPVIDGETVTVEPGAVTALVGPNGSGKSTLLKGLADQLEPSAGSVLVDGQAVQSLEQKELAQTLGLLSQESTAPDSITVEQLVYHGRYPHRGFFESVGDADERAVDRALELAGCTHLRDQDVSSLSGGQRQLAWIAMVLAQDTDILLLDEPTTFLDLHHQLEVMDIIETLRDESDITIVVVLHDIEQAARLADEMVVLDDGTIHAAGTPSSVVTEGLLADVFRIEAAVEDTPRGPRIEPLSARHEHGTDAQSGGD